MAQIFVSHSRLDSELKSFLLSAFGTTRVKAVFEEIEALSEGRRTAAAISADIEKSDAVFVLLSSNVQKLGHTRDWMLWEAGVGRNKDVWVLEPTSSFGNVAVVIPHLRHYLLFDTNDPWLAYLRQIISSYDDSHVWPSAIAGAGLVAALAERDRGEAAFVGGLAGMILASLSSKRPSGLPTKCPQCLSLYGIHVARTTFRCPVCNAVLRLHTAAATSQTIRT